MRPYTKTDHRLATAFPAACGITAGGLLVLLGTLSTGLHWGLLLPVLGLLMLPFCWRARRHGPRRYEELKIGAKKRAEEQGVGDVGVVFTESEIRELGLIHGPWFELALRECGIRNAELWRRF